jgi:hypothetical protein
MIVELIISIFFDRVAVKYYNRLFFEVLALQKSKICTKFLKLALYYLMYWYKAQQKM